ncbi:MAG: hypothetical protein Ta2G_03700 [Termitinemataceae bacterium]|nr:MAG: hypothetical protein Ta2G_03700 [Termitinemataceae bacterium]
MEILANLFDGLGNTAIMLVAMVILFMELKTLKS